MTFGYKNLAHQAAEAERRAHYSDAASIWLKAFVVARAVDVAWVKTRLGLTYDIGVSLREFGKSVIHKCTFVFNPSMTARNGKENAHYSEGSISQSWDSALKRAGVRHRKAYQSRHTYACWSLSAGANTNFIAQQMGHSSAQMVYPVYGAWMAENNHDQVSLLNQKLSIFAPLMPQALDER